MLSIVLGLLMGIGISVQTVVNTRLRTYIQSPLLAALTSFSVGTLFLLLILIGQSIAIIPDRAIWQISPWWIWIGGVLGATWITINIFVFLQLGPIQTTILPVLGQIVMGMVIDHFGLFHTTIKPVSALQILGMLFVLIGIIVAVTWPILKHRWLQQDLSIIPTHQPISSRWLWIWRGLAIFAGTMVAMQTAINAQLNIAIGSKIHASFISFLVGTCLLFIMVAVEDKRFSNIRFAFDRSCPWWIWIGGILGAMFVILSVLLVPLLGVGQLLVLVLLGQLLGSICIEQYGWFKVPKKSLQLSQILGLSLLLIGVAIIRLLT